MHAYVDITELVFPKAQRVSFEANLARFGPQCHWKPRDLLEALMEAGHTAVNDHQVCQRCAQGSASGCAQGSASQAPSASY